MSTAPKPPDYYDEASVDFLQVAAAGSVGLALLFPIFLMGEGLGRHVSGAGLVWSLVVGFGSIALAVFYMVRIIRWWPDLADRQRWTTPLKGVLAAFGPVVLVALAVVASVVLLLVLLVWLLLSDSAAPIRSALADDGSSPRVRPATIVSGFDRVAQIHSDGTITTPGGGERLGKIIYE